MSNEETRATMPNQMPNIYRVAITPRERLVLLSLLGSPPADAIRGRKAERAYFRAAQATGVTKLLETARRHQGRIGVKRINLDAPNVHTLTAENVEFLLVVVGEMEKDAATALELGPLFERLESLGAGEAPQPPEGALAYVEASEDWTPEPPKPAIVEATCPGCGQKFGVDELTGKVTDETATNAAASG